MLFRLLGSSYTVTTLTGGDVNSAALAENASEKLVIKWKHSASAGLFEAEADGLGRLRSTGTLRVPEVIEFDDSSDPAWLAMEYIELKPPTDYRRFGRNLADGLAALHQSSPSPTGQFGLDRNNFLGSQPQNNDWSNKWHVFYRDRRLVPQVQRAQRAGFISTERSRLLDRVITNIEALLDGFSAEPVLIHGDLWSGNFLANGDEPVLIDPAVYFAEREVEIAYTELFSGFPPGFHDAYQQTFPLNGGYDRRRPLHQLYPLLIHLNHFGEAYGPSVDNACRMLLR